MLRIVKTKQFKQFVPFIVLVVGGSFFLREFTEVKYKYRKVQSYDDVKHDVENLGVKMNAPKTLEEEYENITEKLDFDNWENKRIPRPWEEPDTKKS